MGKPLLQEQVFLDRRNHRAGICLVNRIKLLVRHLPVEASLDKHHNQANQLGAYLANLILHPVLLVEDFYSKISNNSSQGEVFLVEPLNHLGVISSNHKETQVLVQRQLNNNHHHCLE